jgi:signal transduction histidine kinase
MGGRSRGMGAGDGGQVRGRTLAYQYWIPAVVLGLVLLTAAVMFWIYRLTEKQRVDFESVDAIMDLQVRTARFHLLFEEAITEGTVGDVKRFLPELDEAERLAHALAYGGESEHGTSLPPLQDPHFWKLAEKIHRLLAELRAIASERRADPKAGATGSLLDVRFDAIYEEIHQTAQALERGVESSLAEDQARTRRLFIAVALLWAFCVAMSTAGFLKLESRRRRAERALEGAYGEMEARVLDRTAELADANESLRNEVADRRRAEDALGESEAGFRRLTVQFRTLLETIPDHITLVSRDLKILWANRGADHISRAAGRAPGEEYCHTLWHNQGAPCDGCPAGRSFTTGRAEGAHISMPDGRHWDIRTVPIQREDGTIENVLEVATDITEKVLLQAEAVRAARLASIGELAAGVAHEINNPINGIINYAQIQRNKSSEGSREHDVAVRILKEGERISDIVRGLLSLARDGKEEKGPVSAEKILSESLALTRSQLNREGILLRVAVPGDLPDVVAIPQQIQQVFMNLISNARYALNEKYPGAHEDKVLEIRGERIAVDGVPFVRVTFRDQGIGIPADLVQKVMAPFFTTKPGAKGTGLGLSISHGILYGHGGRLAIESVEGEFTNLILELPAREDSHGENSRRR